MHSGAMFFGKLTTKETLNYYAALKMSRSAPVKDKKEKVLTPPSSFPLWNCLLMFY